MKRPTWTTIKKSVFEWINSHISIPSDTVTKQDIAPEIDDTRLTDFERMCLKSNRNLKGKMYSSTLILWQGEDLDQLYMELCTLRHKYNVTFAFGGWSSLPAKLVTSFLYDNWSNIIAVTDCDTMSLSQFRDLQHIPNNVVLVLQCTKLDTISKFYTNVPDKFTTIGLFGPGVDKGEASPPSKNPNRKKKARTRKL